MYGDLKRRQLREEPGEVNLDKVKIKILNKDNNFINKSKRFLIWVLNTSSVHGLNHVTQKERHPLERVLWLISVLLALAGSIYLILLTMFRYQTSATVVTMDINWREWNVSFPTLTLCHYPNIDNIKLEKFITDQNPKNRTALREFITALAYYTYANMSNIIDYPEIKSEDYMKILWEVGLDHNEPVTTGSAMLASVTKMKPMYTITEYGICFSINSKLAAYNNYTYWMADRWDIIPDDVNHPFLRSHAFETSVQVVMNLKPNMKYMTYIHSTYDTLDRNEDLQISINARSERYMNVYELYSSPEVRRLKPEYRNCRFHYESNLEHSPVYSYRLCMAECRIKLALEKCNCIPHYYRKKKGEKVCSVRQFQCIQDHKREFLTLRYENNTRICVCVPNCDDSVFNTVKKVQQVNFTYGPMFQYGLSEYPKYRFKREILFSFDDLLVSIGGMFGLFLGASILSFVEFIYFFTLRFFFYTLLHKEIN